MSLILEALRKSEAERRRGQAPGLHAELPPLVAARPKRLPPWLGVVATLLIASCVLWWFSTMRSPKLVTQAPADLAEPVATSVGTQAVDPSAFPRVDQIDPAPTAQHQGTQQPKGESEPFARPITPSVGEVQGVRSSPATRATNVPVPPPQTRVSSEPDAPELIASTPTPMSATSAERGPPAAKPPTSRQSGAPPNVAELPAAERGQLPELKLTMHMWNERPSQRFVILDGTRYGEGDRVGAAVITRIESNGVILDLNGRQVRLPLR